MIAERLAGLLCLFCIGLTTAGASEIPKVMNLNDPIDMAEVAKINPAHYEKIEKIIKGINRQRSEQVARWIKVTFKANDVIFPEILLVSLPPKRRLSFVLDDIRYEGLITQYESFRPIPAKTNRK